jgi:hypothetical protein
MTSVLNKTKSPKPITKAEALARSKEHQHEFKRMQARWLTLGKEVSKSLELGVPEKLGQNVREWLETFFDESASHIFRQVQSYRALRGVPTAQLERIPEGNAHELKRLPEKERTAPKMIERAIEMRPSEFRDHVEAIVVAKRPALASEPKEKWFTYARRVPEPVYDALMAAEAKLSRVLEIDIETEELRPKNLIPVLEGWAELVNGTAECVLKTELVGGGPFEELAIETLNSQNSVTRLASTKTNGATSATTLPPAANRENSSSGMTLLEEDMRRGNEMAGGA